MYFRFGIVCASAAGVAGSAHVLGLDNVPWEATRFAAALHSMQALETYAESMDNLGVDLLSLATFLKSAESSDWIRSQRSRLESDRGAAFDLIVSILQHADAKFHFDHGCLPPLRQYIDKQLDENEIKFVASLYTLDDDLSEQDISRLSEVGNFDKVFGPIIAKFQQKCDSDPESCESARSSCLEKTRLRRVATVLTSGVDEFQRIAGVPRAGLGAKAEEIERVLTRHLSQIRTELDFSKLYHAMKKFEKSRSASSKPDLNPVFRFVWYYSSAELCRAYANIISSAKSIKDYEYWFDDFGSKYLTLDFVWAAICALNARDDFQAVRLKRSELFQNRSDIVQTALRFMADDPQPHFRGLLEEVFLQPGSGSDASILGVPAVHGYAFIHDQDSFSMVLSPDYKAIVDAYLSGDIDPLLFTNLWGESGMVASESRDLMDWIARNPFSLASAVHGADCASLLETRLVDTVDRCDALKAMDSLNLVRALVAALTTVKYRSAREAMRIALSEVNP